jgi:hypothetical protein
MFREPEFQNQNFQTSLLSEIALAELVCHSALQMCTRNVQTNLVPLFSRVLLAGVRKRGPVYLFTFLAVTLLSALISTASNDGTIG